MKTEIQGDFKSYFLRFKLPTKKCFLMPFKSAGLIFLCEIVLTGLFILLGDPNWFTLLNLMLCMFAICYYIKVLWKDFWNVVLEESKGFFSDAIMWTYYLAVCVISLLPAFVLFYLSE